MEAKRMSLYKEAGARIRAIRLEKGYTRESMAAHIKLSGKFLYDIEFGRKGFSADVLLRIANYLETGCDYIMTGKECVIKERHE